MDDVVHATVSVSDYISFRLDLELIGLRIPFRKLHLILWIKTLNKVSI